MTSSNERLVPVEQIDREAAADIWRDYIARTGEIIVERNMREGGLDEGLPALLARHRLAALRTPPAVEPDEGLVELIERLKEGVVNIGMHDDKATELFDIEEADHAMFEAAQKLDAMTTSIRAQALEEAAKVAEWAHMVPPDGGSPSEAECEVAKNAAAAIRDLKGGQGV